MNQRDIKPANPLERIRRQLRRRRARIVRAALRAHEAPDPRALARVLRDVRPSAWLARQVDALLRRGDRWAAEVERACAAQLGSILQGPTNPTSGWRGATGRLRGIAPGAEGLYRRREELKLEAWAAGHDVVVGELSPVYRGHRRPTRTGPGPDHLYLHGAIAESVVALWDLGVVRSRLRAGWPAGRALSSLTGQARGRVKPCETTK